MEPKKFNLAIKESWHFVCDAGIGRSISNPTSLTINDIFQDIIFSNNPKYSHIYRTGLSLSHYNFILTDFSYFQFSLLEESLRYAFYPNPFLLKEEIGELDTYLLEGLLSLEEYNAQLESAEITHNVPHIRYDHAPGQYKEIQHTTAHFHIGCNDGSRWPVSKILTPMAFTMLILKHYYNDDWGKSGHDDQFIIKYESALAQERSKCSELNESFFSPKEKQLFYFT